MMGMKRAVSSIPSYQELDQNEQAGIPMPPANSLSSNELTRRVFLRNTAAVTGSLLAQLGYIACLLGRKLTWDPVKEESPGDDEANRLVQGQPGLPPWTIE